MEKISDRMTEFLQAFERSRTKDVEPAALYADVFLAGGPEGARCIRVEDFLRALPKRKEMFERAGCRKMELTGVTETALDGRYTMARTRWRMIFEPEGRNELAVEVESTFIVDFGGETPRIIAYLSHQNAIEEYSKLAESASHPR